MISYLWQFCRCTSKEQDFLSGFLDIVGKVKLKKKYPRESSNDSANEAQFLANCV